jgi:hypothetical protein
VVAGERDVKLAAKIENRLGPDIAVKMAMNVG